MILLFFCCVFAVKQFVIHFCSWCYSILVSFYDFRCLCIICVFLLFIWFHLIRFVFINFGKRLAWIKYGANRKQFKYRLLFVIFSIFFFVIVYCQILLFALQLYHQNNTQSQKHKTWQNINISVIFVVFSLFFISKQTHLEIVCCIKINSPP